MLVLAYEFYSSSWFQLCVCTRAPVRPCARAPVRPRARTPLRVRAHAGPCARASGFLIQYKFNLQPAVNRQPDYRQGDS